MIGFLNEEDAVKNGMINPDSTKGKKLGFTSDKFDGYLWEEGRIIYVSLIISLDEHKGNFRLLLNTLCEKYDKVLVPIPFPRMQKILLKYGFTGDSDMMVYSSQK